MKMRSALGLAILLATTAFARAEPTAAGFWEALDDSGKPEGWFLFTQKGDVYSARLVKGFKKEGDDSAPPDPLCSKCAGKKKDAHVMGLTLFWGMKRDGLNYSDGSVLDPRDGSVYHAKMWLDEDGKTLHVRGYLGISLLGKTQDWRRLPDDAMKKDEVPKELLAGMDAKSDGKTADKAKPHKGKKKSDAPADDAAAAPAPEASKEAQ